MWRRRWMFSGYGFGPMWCCAWRPFVTKEDYLEMLEDYKRELTRELERIEREIEKIKKESK